MDRKLPKRPRIPVVLVLDTSGSMLVTEGGTPTGKVILLDGKRYRAVTGGETRLDRMQRGVTAFYRSLQADETLRRQVELAVVTSADGADVLSDFAAAADRDIPSIPIGSRTTLGAGMLLALAMLEDRCRLYKEAGVPQGEAWLVLLTDGEDNGSPEDLAQAKEWIAELTAQTEPRLHLFTWHLGGERSQSPLSDLAVEQASGTLRPLLQRMTEPLPVEEPAPQPEMPAVPEPVEGMVEPEPVPQKSSDFHVETWEQDSRSALPGKSPAPEKKMDKPASDPSDPQLEALVRERMIMMDTCTLMHEGCDKLIDRLLPLLTKHGRAVCLPQRVIEELRHHSWDHRDRSKAASAARGYQLCKKLQDAGCLSVRSSKLDSFADNVLFVLFTKYRYHEHLLLITQDRKLTMDILQLNKTQSSTGYPAEVMYIDNDGKLHGAKMLKPKGAAE